ncbi:MAG: hypothetical protein AVDCRST_MAG68-5119 [uncultured Gemmatimonadetes bacterium]|uniref:Uncharacterized protein n=1 Tax=uncultured Gemmatimonadota bacterium TaxID=203437 RepID=A0A6J4MP91_9BACT|nr:MAG: hypothetical protein AVDCRST_MAG68-5119 [uncultured Gemmatimonadota bacterium]
MSGFGADEDLLPGSFRDGRWAPAPTMPTRGEAIRTILGAVELQDEAAVEEALMALGVNPFELFRSVAA